MLSQDLIKNSQVQSDSSLDVSSSPCLGDYAQQVIEQQYYHFAKQEQKVLADKKPEPLHQMRVGLRRLRTALKIFADVIVLPKAASEKSLRDVARVLGELRDFDVQLVSLQTDYRPYLPEAEQASLDEAIATLSQRRTKTFRKVADTLNKSRYQTLKGAYEEWLSAPRYKPLAEMPLGSTLPDLLSPLLSTLLLHPGWLIPLEAVSEENSEVLHDLRKACKYARYQAEFFTPFYGEAFQTWVNEIKELQSRLGQLHDAQVMTTLLTHLKQKPLPALQAKLAENQQEALSTWETTRQRYLTPEFRYQLHHLILQPQDGAIVSSGDTSAS